MKRLALTSYEYFSLYASLASLGIVCLLWLPIAVVLHFVLPKKYGIKIGRYVIMISFRIYLWCLSRLGVCQFDLSELDSLSCDEPMIIAPNHPCLLDAIFVISRLQNVACIMKAELVNNIFLGAGSRLAGYIKNDNKIRMVKSAVHTLHSGSHVLIFPEGTRTTRHPVNPFVGSVGLISRHARTPVQTVFIETNSPYLSKGWPLFRKPTFPIHYRVRLGKRFFPPSDSKTFNAELEGYFATELSQQAALP